MPAAVTTAPPRVFFVEDSAAVRERLEALGRVAGGVTGGHATTAADAIRGILACMPDLVLLDLQLGEGSGFDVLRAVQRVAPQIPIYVVTNHDTPPNRELARRLGARGFFDKTNEFEQVRAAIAARAARPPQ